MGWDRSVVLPNLSLNVSIVDTRRHRRDNSSKTRHDSNNDACCISVERTTNDGMNEGKYIVIHGLYSRTASRIGVIFLAGRTHPSQY